MFTKQEVYQNMFTDYNRIKLKLNSRETAKKSPNIWRLNNIHLNNIWKEKERERGRGKGGMGQEREGGGKEREEDKPLNKPGLERKIFNLIRNIMSQNLTAKQWYLNAFPLSSGVRQECPLTTPIQHHTASPSYCKVY